MTNEEFIILAEKVADGNASISELALYNASYESFQKDPQNLAADGLDLKALEKESLARFWKTAVAAKPVIKLWSRIAVVAAAVAAIVFGVLFFKAPPHPEGSAATRDLINDISPGKNTATLTLANGKTIILSDVKTGVIVNANSLKYNDGTAVERVDPGQGREEVVMSTPRGGTYQITLPDGTRAWLNADTKISFPSQFIGKERKILLVNGEVYFEVSKNKEKPFIVETSRQIVEVLGTHFNINAYNDERSTKTTLLEGSVRVSTLRGGTRKPPKNDGLSGEAVILKPNQQSIITGSNQIAVTNIDVAEVVDWKNNEFRFNDADLKSIMRKVSRWYNIEVVYDGDIPQQKLDGVVSRSRNISQVLKMLEKTGNVSFKIKGDQVFVRNNKK